MDLISNFVQMVNMKQIEGISTMKYVRNPKIMYKFGYTDMADANQRFSVETARIRKFANVPLGRDFEVRTRWSAFFPLNEALQMEEVFKEMFPIKNVSTDVFYNGITECRYFKPKEANAFIQGLKDLYPKSVYGFKEGYMKVYFAMFLRKV